MNMHLLPSQVSTPVLESNQGISRNSDQAKSGALRFLALSLTAAGWLTVAPLSGQAATSQIDLICAKEAEHFVCNPAANQATSAIQESQVTATIVPQFFTPTEQANISDALLGLTYLLPIGLGLGIFLYDRYAQYRASLLQQQINALEQIWQRHTTH